MPTRYDLAYWIALAAASPAIAALPKLRRKVVSALRTRDGHGQARSNARPCIVVHGVSVGEINAARALIEQLRQRRADLAIAVAATTETGFARAVELFGENIEGDTFAVRYPVDSSSAMSRFFNRLRPAVIVALELEIWPNLALLCERRGIPLIVANGRMTHHSHRAYRRIGPLMRRTFGRVSRVLAQGKTYADRFISLGVPAQRVEVAGSMKFDSALVADRVAGDAEVAAAVGLNPRRLGGDEAVIVAGSTGPGEEVQVLNLYEKLQETHAGLRLVIVPRKPERFDEVADLIAHSFPLTRRSGGQITHEGIVLGDTMGELRTFYSLADVVVVGRTFVDLGEKQHGSDMIEPAGLGRPVLVGQYTGNFAEPMRALLQGGGVVQTSEPADAETTRCIIDGWLRNPADAVEVGGRGQQVVLDNRGATARTVECVLGFVGDPNGT